MKIMKKLSAILLTLCLCVPCFSMIAHAADGRISFTDPKTAVGEIVEVKCVARSTSGDMSEMEIKLSYDTAYLRFDSGNDVKEDGNGTLTYTAAGGSSEATVTVKFQALKEGTTKISVSSSDISDENGLSLDLDEGNSTVTIAEGDPSKITEGASKTSSAADVEVDVNGTTYTLTDNFADTDIPNGYSRTQVSLDGAEHQMVEHETSGACLAYLIDAEDKGDFFLYNEEDATFSPYEEVAISDTASIIILSDDSKVNLPKTYQKAKLTLNDKEFPVWQDNEHDGFYVMYAMNSDGEEGFYQYDSQEGTYQRFEPAAADEEKKADKSSLMGKIQNFLEKNIQLVVLVGGLGTIVILLVIIILAVKLHNRNAELDELYDEYGIDEEEEEPVKPAKAAKEKRSLFGKRKKNDEDDFEEYEDDGFDEYEDEEFGEEEYEDEYDDFEEEEYEDSFDEGLFGDTVAIDTKAFAEYDYRAAHEELSIDDLDDLLSANPNKKRGHMEPDDTFEMDIIDLD